MVSPESVINKYLENEHVTFVFPSEIVAEAMLHKTAADCARRVIPRDRFVSWDRFKEMTFRFRQDRTPVNNFLRTLFCANLLAENTIRPFLFSLILPEHAKGSSNSLSSFKNNLPLLANAGENILSLSLPETINRMKLADILLVYKKYRDYLDQLALYEPDCETPVFLPDEMEYHIFYPEVISDFQPVSSMLKMEKAVHLHMSEEIRPEAGGILVFENSMQELRWLVAGIDKALGEGVDPADIAVTVAGHESFLPFFEAEAMLADIPLQIKTGKPIISYPGVNLFKHMERVVDSMFGVHEIQTLVSNRSIPWKNIELLVELVEFGYAQNCIGGHNEGRKRVDIWDRHFDRLKKNDSEQEYRYPELQEVYHKLRRLLNSVVQAVSFTALKNAAHAFCAEMLDMSRFGEWELKYFQYALRILDESVLFAGHAASVCTGQKIKPFSIWFSVLGETTYVKPGAKNGIPVYPYRVSAGIRPRLHFIVNASHAGTSVVKRTFPFMTSREESMLPDSVGDYSEAFIRLYRHSGDQVFFSYSRRGFDDAHLAPQAFIRDGNMVEADCGIEPDKLSRRTAERLAWACGDPDTGSGITACQRDGFEAARKTALAKKKVDFTEKPIGDAGLVETVNGVLRDESGLLHVNSTGLTLFMTCRFGYFMERVVAEKEMVLENDFRNDREYGNMIHHVFEKFFRMLMDEGEAFFGKDRERYKKMFFECVSLAASYWEMRKPLPPFPLWDIRKDEILDGFSAFCEKEGERYEKYTVQGAEEKLKYRIPGKNVLVDGKLDLVVLDEDGLRIVDYKKKTVPGRGKAPDLRKNPTSLQMPLYLFLAERNGMDVHTASYYSFLDEKYHDFISKDTKNPVQQRAMLEEWFSVLLEEMAGMETAVREGSFVVSQDAQGMCKNCTWRPVCRTRFVIH